MRFACDQSNCDDSLGNSPADNHRPCKFGCESPGLLASATLSAIARFAIVHRAILTGLLTVRLVRRKTHCANRGCQDRKQDFETILHNQPSLASIANASGKEKSALATLQVKRLPYNDSSGSFTSCPKRSSSPLRSITPVRCRT